MPKNAKVILIAGCSSSVGVALAERLLIKGHVVYGGYNSRPVKIDHPNFTPLKLNIDLDADCEKAIQLVNKSAGRIDVVVNLVGKTLAGPTDSFSSNDLSEILNINVVGALRLLKPALSLMKDQKYGRIINTSSLCGFMALPNFGIYSASKFGLEALTRSAYYETKGTGVNVTTISPGAFVKETPKSVLTHKSLRDRFPLVRYLFPITAQKQIVDVYEKVINSANPPARVIVGPDAFVCYWLVKLLPDSWLAILIGTIWKRK